jgi:hypothetical protein
MMVYFPLQRTGNLNFTSEVVMSGFSTGLFDWAQHPPYGRHLGWNIFSFI